MLSYQDSISVIEHFYKDCILWHRLKGKTIYEAIRKAQKEVALLEDSPFRYITGDIDPKAKEDFLTELNTVETM